GALEARLYEAGTAQIGATEVGAPKVLLTHVLTGVRGTAPGETRGTGLGFRPSAHDEQQHDEGTEAPWRQGGRQPPLLVEGGPADDVAAGAAAEPGARGAAAGADGRLTCAGTASVNIRPANATSRLTSPPGPTLGAMLMLSNRTVRGSFSTRTR